MYLKTIKAVKKWMLFRPMIPDPDLNILLSGSIRAGTGGEEPMFTPDTSHLTCFIGGMVGMAAKLFELEEDFEIAKRLTNGCV